MTSANDLPKVIGERAKGHRGVASIGAIDLSFPPGSAFDTLGDSFIRRFASPPSRKVTQTITGRPLLFRETYLLERVDVRLKTRNWQKGFECSASVDS
ncbi:hypothetical protein AVEN_70208-1 [Araneus ventricosus]|uniref:Uncharacterized protein n=1 Tax=Araneus ventricosus TaxID=182803 RepID=A0A4Y2FEW7_ARAVE|nr:hypothetical protein AVEN_70208-1 [Araneus ventricosus]